MVACLSQDSETHTKKAKQLHLQALTIQGNSYWGRSREQKYEAISGLKVEAVFEVLVVEEKFSNATLLTHSTKSKSSSFKISSRRKTCWRKLLEMTDQSTYSDVKIHRFTVIYL